MSRNPSVSHPGRSPSSPPDTLEPGRSSKGKRTGRTRPRPDRNFRPEEERFNVGPKATRNTSAARTAGRRQTRSARADRVHLNDIINDGVPNYPPPSFQEAISTPPLSGCPSTVTLVPSSSPSPMASLPPLVIPGNNAEPQQSTPMGQPPSTASSGLNSDSDESLQIVDEDDAVPPGVDPTFLRKVRQDYRNRRGVDFPSPVCPPSPQPQDNIARRLDLVAILDGPDDTPRSPSIVSSPARRFLSLSPLRTFFPSRSPTPGQPDRPHSAHPSPGTSPYAHGGRNGSSIFRSTTSLSTNSFLRLPLTSSPHQGRSESFIARRIFSGKGKEKAKDTQPQEALDSWEELKKEELDESENGQPQGLMAVVANVSKQTSVKAGTSPTRSLSFTYGAPPSESLPSLHASLAQSAIHLPVTPRQEAATPPPREVSTPPAIQTPPATPPAPPAVHPLSLRDRKTPFVQRPVRKKSPSPRPPPIYVPPPVSDPVITTVRTRMAATPPPSQPTVPKPHSSVTRPSPLGLESFSIQQEEGPVPVEVPDVSVASPPIQTPIPARPTVSGVSICRCGSPDGQATLPALSRTPSPASPDDSITPTRHYPGRPLPRPPTQTRPHIDSTFAPNEEYAETSIESSASICPEGLLIDLDDSGADGQGVTASTRGTDVLRRHSPPPLIDLDSSSEDIPSLLTTPDATQVVAPIPTMNAYSEITDLDLLVSNLADSEGNDNSNYDVSSHTQWKGTPDPSALNAVNREGAPGDYGIYRPGSTTPRDCWNPDPLAEQWRRSSPTLNDDDSEVASIFMRQYQYRQQHFGPRAC
ncbi:hypothetical protein CC2G_013778 [Coprinopsis cinerea AmutBmut pab1-1]|nr:hypothetical protein CC2G_013778 [Coprinopsis cinerea AmutBmut pab1-1]